MSEMMLPGGTQDQADENVTKAILEAEDALRTAIKKWEDVWWAEARLVEVTSGVDQQTASRGMGLVRMRITVLTALLGER